METGFRIRSCADKKAVSVYYGGPSGSKAMNVKPNTQNANAVEDFPVDDLRARHLRPQDMPWQKLRFPGCEMKTLLFDPKSGLATMLMKMEPVSYTHLTLPTNREV